MVCLAVLISSSIFLHLHRLLYPYWAGGLAGRKETRVAVAAMPRAASAAHQGQGGASWRLPRGCRRRPNTGIMFGSWDFISDATTRGGALPMLTILDEYTRECHVLRADRALKSSDVLEGIGRAIAEHGSPVCLRSDMVPSLSPRKSSEGWPPPRSRRSVSSPVVRGKMASLRVYMDACATSASTGSSSRR